MKPHFIDPARLKSLIESAEADLGLSPDAAEESRHSIFTRRGDALPVRLLRLVLSLWRFGKPLAAPSRRSSARCSE